MTPTWLIPAVPAAILAAFAVARAARALCMRRAEWRAAANIARRVQERRAEVAYLNQLYTMESAGERS